MNILVTGGAGYIGSHIVKSLSETEHKVVVLDNLVKGHKEAVMDSEFIYGDLEDKRLLDRIMKNYEIEGVIHLAAYSLVSESMEKPGKYYHNNISNGLNLLEAMVNNGVKYIVFSSTAAVYGEPNKVPISENHPTKPTNIYGETKLFFERMLARYSQIYGLSYISLRYFNAAGADPSGKIGEAHNPETHLIPIILQKVLGKREKLYIFGDNYSTRDGTCIRDYIHVNDLSKAHLLSIDALADGIGNRIYNLGNGEGFSVKEVIKTASEVVGREIKVEVGDRRLGDPKALVASSKKIKEELNWVPKYPELITIIKTAWNWHKRGDFYANT